MRPLVQYISTETDPTKFSRAALINKILYNNRIDYHAAGSYDVCRLRTRM